MSTAPIHVSRKDDPTGLLDRALRAAFPDCTVANVTLFAGRPTIDLTEANYWSSGYRRMYAVIRLADCKVMPIPSAHPAFERNVAMDPALRSFHIPPEAAVIVRVYSGTRQYLEVWTSNPTPMLEPPKADLTRAEAIMLHLTAGLKSSYAGISDYRAHEAKREYGLTDERIAAARVALKARKLLNAAGAITNAGKNLWNNLPDVWSYKEER